jgi:hypothetical protein
MQCRILELVGKQAEARNIGSPAVTRTGSKRRMVTFSASPGLAPST